MQLTDLNVETVKTLPMSDLKKGEKGTVIEINTKGLMRQRLMEMGLTRGIEVKFLRKGAFGDPTSYLIRGTMIALRKEEASEIKVKLNDSTNGEVKI